MIAGIVLAAGRSKRLGRPKQLLPYRGRPLLEWALVAMRASGVDLTIVVLGHAAGRVRAEVDLDGVRVVLNPDHHAGLGGSLCAGLDALDELGAASGVPVDAALCAVGDQPLLRAATLGAMLAAHRATGAPIVAADYGLYRGTPLLLARTAWPEARAVAGDRDRGAGALLRDTAWPVASVPVPPTQGLDIDTWADYEALLNAPADNEEAAP